MTSSDACNPTRMPPALVILFVGSAWSDAAGEWVDKLSLHALAAATSDEGRCASASSAFEEKLVVRVDRAVLLVPAAVRLDWAPFVLRRARVDKSGAWLGERAMIDPEAHLGAECQELLSPRLEVVSTEHKRFRPFRLATHGPHELELEMFDPDFNESPNHPVTRSKTLYVRRSAFEKRFFELSGHAYAQCEGGMPDPRVVYELYDKARRACPACRRIVATEDLRSFRQRACKENGGEVDCGF